MSFTRYLERGRELVLGRMGLSEKATCEAKVLRKALISLVRN